MYTRTLALATSGLLVLGMHSVASSAQLSETDQALLQQMVAKYGKTAVSDSLRQHGKSAPAQIVKAPTTGSAAPLASAGPATDGFTILTKQEATVPQFSRCAGLIALLRQDWQDVAIGSCPDTVDKATGAQISYSDDRVANNRVWSAQGTAALLYNSIIANDPQAVSLFDTSFGGYVTIDRVMNSSPAKSSANVDTVAYGGVAEIGISTPANIGWVNYFRVRGGGVEDDLKGTTSVNVTAEYIPVNPYLNIHTPFEPFGSAPFIVRFDPELIAQYDDATGKNSLLAFNNRPQALRLGPQLTMKLFPLPGAPDFISHFTSSTTYHWAYESYSGSSFSWFQTALTYNIDKAGHLGWTGSYQRGQNENTGAFTNIYKIALTGKI
jgi:hypothetical protein